MKFADSVKIVDIEMLSARARYALAYNGPYKTVGEVRAATDGELLRLANLGRVTLVQVRAVLADRSLPTR
jgi:hypothetical protein